MQLVQSWNESLSLFKPANLKLFLLIILKSINELYLDKFLGYWFFFIILLDGLYVYFGFPTLLSVFDIYFNFWVMVYCVVQLIFVFFMFVASRPSVTLKNGLYFVRNAPYFIPFMLWVVLGVIFHLLSKNTVSIVGNIISIIFGVWTGAFAWLLKGVLPCMTTSDVSMTGLLCYVWIQLLQIWFIPLTMFFILFMLDSDGMPWSIFQSLYRAMKMVYYNYPAIILLYILSTVAYGSILFAIGLTPLGQWIPWGLFFAPIPISIFTNFYIKYVHSQFTLYFGEKKKA